MCFIDVSCAFTQTCSTLNINASAISRLLMNNENCLQHTAALSPQQGQSSSSPHPASILSRPSVFHIPRHAPAPAWPEPEQEDTVVRAFSPSSSSSSSSSPLCLPQQQQQQQQQQGPDRAVSSPLLSLLPLPLNQPPVWTGLLPAGHTDPCWMKAVKA